MKRYGEQATFTINLLFALTTTTNGTRVFTTPFNGPDTKTSCCNLTDCRPTQGRVVGDHYEIKVNGAWIAVPANKIAKKSAPDMGFHVCAPFKFDGKPENLYCVVLPPET